MKMQKFLSAALALALATAGFAACSGSNGEDDQPPASGAGAVMGDASSPSDSADSQPTASGISVTDMTGKTFTLEKPAERVVALTAADAEITAALGAADVLVGRGEYCDYPAEIQNAPTVQSGSEANLEQIIALNPEVVLMSTMDQSEEQALALEKAGIACIQSSAQDIEGVYEAVRMIGAALGKNEEAEQLVAGMRSDFAAIRDKVPQSADRPTIYFEVSPLEYGLWAAGKNTFMNEIADMLGLENIFADIDGWGEVSQEQVIERDPDYIVTITMYYGDGLNPVDEIAAREGWQGIAAVREGNVLPADSDEISRPGPRLVDAASSLFDRVYGNG